MHVRNTFKPLLDALPAGGGYNGLLYFHLLIVGLADFIFVGIEVNEIKNGTEIRRGGHPE